MSEDRGTDRMDAEPGLELRSHKIRIEVVRGPDAGAIAEIAGPDARIGSGKDADFILHDPKVSRLHLLLRIEGDHLRVLDTGSRNGTSVDGTRIRDAYARSDSLIRLGETTIRLRMLRAEVVLPLSKQDRFGLLLGRSVAMRRLFAQLERAAPTDATLLVEGETGTGKELVARSVHEASQRAGRPFVIFDGSAVSEHLIESELFGHVRGAFTGALRDRVGRFEAANGGTLFLDEIGELPPELQPKLLRALENREVVPVGDNKPRRVDVRVIAATNRSLLREVDRGSFREDLYYRLAVIRVRLPPLRERADDIPQLVRHFEEEWRARGCPRPPIPDAALAQLKQHAWPGNLRELRNRVDQLLALGVPELSDEDECEEAAPSPGEIAVNLDVPFHVGLRQIKEAYQRAYVEAALAQAGGNVSKAARLGGVGRAFVQRVMRGHQPRAEAPSEEREAEAS